MTNNTVVQSLFLKYRLSLPQGSTYIGDVSGVRIDVDCEEVPIENIQKTSLPWFSIAASYFVANISTPTCKINTVIIGRSPDHNHFQIENTTQNYQGNFGDYTCNDGANNGRPISERPPSPGDSDRRFVVSMADVRWERYGTENSLTKNWRIEKAVGLLCKASHAKSMYSASFPLDGKTPVTLQKLPGEETKLSGFSDNNLTTMIQASLGKAQFGSGGDDYAIIKVPSLFLMISGMTRTGLEPLMNQTLLRNLTMRALQGVGTQSVFQYLVRNETSTIMGSVVTLEDRLLVKQIPIALMASTLALLMCISVFLIFMSPRDTVPCTPDTLASAAVILTASQRLRAFLSDLTPYALKKKGYLSERFQTRVDRKPGEDTHSFVIDHVAVHEREAVNETQSAVGVPKWWRPFTLGIPFLAASIFLPVVLIALLEIIQRLSDSRDGLVTMSPTATNQQLAVRFIPALVMLSVATMYTSLDFNLSVFAPFTALKRGSAQAATSLNVNLVGMLPPHALFVALKNRHVAHGLTILAAFVSSFLTIVVSGLYSTRPIVASTTLLLQQADAFNLTHKDFSVDDGFAGTTTNLLQMKNLTYPQWTYKNLVFPSFSAHVPNGLAAAFGGSSATSDISTISMRVPAIRGSLKCTTLPSENFDINYGWSQYTGLSTGKIMEVTIKSNLSWNMCDIPRSQLPITTWPQAILVSNTTAMSNKTVYLGRASAIRWNSGSSRNTTSGSIDIDSNLDVTPYGCPSIAFTIGTLANTISEQRNGTNRTTKKVWKGEFEMSVNLCQQVLEEVQTNLTLQLPQLFINASSPPVVDESTARVLNVRNGSESSWFTSTSTTEKIAAAPRFDASLRTLFLALSNNWVINDLTGGTVASLTDELDGATKVLAFGKYGIPLSEMVNDPEVLAKAASNLYSEYAAQLINANMRADSIPSNIPLPIYNSTISVPRYRLVQNAQPKLALQILLGVMVLFGAVAYALADTKEVLPHNPCSIAGKMMLLAPSEMCETRNVIPAGAEWWSPRDAKKNRLFDGWLFSLGWWTLPNGKKWYGIDVAQNGLVERESDTVM